MTGVKSLLIYFQDTAKHFFGFFQLVLALEYSCQVMECDPCPLMVRAECRLVDRDSTAK